MDAYASEITNADNFMMIKVSNQRYTIAGIMFYNIQTFLCFLMYPQLCYRRADMGWVVDSGPTWFKLVFGSMIFLLIVSPLPLNLFLHIQDAIAECYGGNPKPSKTMDTQTEVHIFNTTNTRLTTD